MTGVVALNTSHNAPSVALKDVLDRLLLDKEQIVRVLLLDLDRRQGQLNWLRLDSHLLRLADLDLDLRRRFQGAGGEEAFIAIDIIVHIGAIAEAIVLASVAVRNRCKFAN